MGFRPPAQLPSGAEGGTRILRSLGDRPGRARRRRRFRHRLAAARPAGLGDDDRGHLHLRHRHTAGPRPAPCGERPRTRRGLHPRHPDRSVPPPDGLVVPDRPRGRLLRRRPVARPGRGPRHPGLPGHHRAHDHRGPLPRHLRRADDGPVDRGRCRTGGPRPAAAAVRPAPPGAAQGGGGRVPDAGGHRPGRRARAVPVVRALHRGPLGPRPAPGLRPPRRRPALRAARGGGEHPARAAVPAAFGACGAPAAAGRRRGARRGRPYGADRTAPGRRRRDRAAAGLLDRAGGRGAASPPPGGGPAGRPLAGVARPRGLDQVLDAFPAESALRSGWRRLRAELRPGAPLFLHAIRIAVGTAAGEAVGRAFGDFWGHALPDHGFWAALTTMLVLFPDYGHTFARGWARPIGSILGGLVAWVVLLPGGWHAGWLVAVATVLAACVFLTLRVGQLVLNFFITAWIVFLITRLGSAAHLIEWGRPADTLVGALLGLVVFVAIPTYHHHRTHELLADWLRVQRRLLPALVTGYAEAGAVDPAEIDVLRRQARQARERLDAAVASLGHEPRRHRSRWSATELTAIQHAVYEIGQCASVLYDRQPGSAVDAVPETAEFAAVLDHHLAELAAVVAAKGRPAEGVLRAAFDATATRSGLADLVDATAPDGVAHARGRALTLCLRTVTAVEELVSRLASGPRDQAPVSSTGPAARRTATTLAGS
ncbi:FUSC family protein [Streptomyces sp. CA-132043]|uniref:FUSC family protein n=1 Tax=Streptomyces sp. CA-132043 TaxID=3240048 RepID=UPI003D92E374